MVYQKISKFGEYYPFWFSPNLQKASMDPGLHGNRDDG